MFRNPSRWSALSEPRNFIAEGALHRFYRHNTSAIWSLFTTAVVIAALGYVVLREPASRPAEGSPQPGHRQDVRAEAVSANRPWSGDDFEKALNAADRPRETFHALPPPPMPEPTQASAPTAPPEPPAPSEQTVVQTAERPASPPPAPPEVSPGTKPDAQAAPAPVQVAAAPEPTHATDTTAAIPRQEPVRNNAAQSGRETARDDLASRGDTHLKRRQFGLARRAFEAAAHQGDVRGALGMARTFDPIYLRSIGSHARGNWPKARRWYSRAAEMAEKPQRTARR